MQEPLQLIVAPDGSIVSPVFHDAKLLGLLSCSDKRLFVFVQSLDAKMHSIALEGTERFRATDFKQDNLIFDLTIKTQRAVQMDLIAYAFEADDTHPVVQTMANKISAGELQLVELKSSYGCSFVGICRNVRLSGHTIQTLCESDQSK